jgi:hypothetical protein
VILADFSVSSSSVPVAAVAVGMWKPAFCAGFQAPRAGRKRCGQSLSIPPSERHFHSKPSILKHFGETVPFGKQFFVKCVPFRKPRKTSTSPDSRSEPNPEATYDTLNAELKARVMNMWLQLHHGPRASAAALR